MPNKTPDHIEKKVLDYSFAHSTHGKDRVAMQLRLKGIFISATGVEKIWRKQRYYSLKELQRDLDIYLWYYNFQRPHSGYRLKGRRPIEVLLGQSNYPKRLTYDKIDSPNNSKVSTPLETVTD